MSNKIKKLICSLLAAAMVVSSASMLVFADGEDTAAGEPAATTEGAEATAAPDATAEPEAEATAAPEAEATAAPEETAAPEATAAPAATAAPTGTAYDDDAYYQKSLALCSSLGVISGFEDGSVKPDEKVTRAQMASIVLRMLNMSTGSTYKDIFTDVQGGAGGHWAADQIQAAYEAGIVNGMGDGTFAPDAQVTYAQVIVMLVNALNFKNEAEMYGGWQQGYIKVAGDKDILKSASSTADEPADRGLVIKMVYNTLLADYNRASSFENGSVQYTADKTLAEDKFEVIEAKGLLIGTSKTSIGTTELDEGQIEIRKNKEDTSEVYDTLLTDLDDCVARMITFYYRENSGRTPEVLAVAYDSSKSETYKIDAEKIEDVEFSNNVLSVKEEKVNKRRVTTSDAKYIYNGKLMSAGDITQDMLQPEKGSITFIKSDKSAVDDYDVVFIDAYETLLVSSASNDKIIAKIAKKQSDEETVELGDTEAITITLDDKIDRTITVTKAGDSIKVRNLKKNDVMTVRASYPLENPEVIDIVVTGESVTGSVSSMSKEWDETTARINGEDYDVANIAVGDLKTGAQGTYYLDQFGRIAYIESSASGQLASGEKYGWIMNMYKAEGSSDRVISLATADGVVEAKFASNVDYWGPTDLDSQQLSRKEAEDALLGIMGENGEGTGFNTTSKSAQVRLVKFKANSSNSISKLYCAVDETKVDDSDALRVHLENLGGIGSASGLVGGYQINDGITEISVPKNASDMKEAANYKFGEVNSSSYVVRENGANFDFVIGEFTNNIAPSVAIKFTDSADAVAYVGDLDTAGNNPVMVVEKINTGVDADDNTVYTFSGYSNGAEVSITTTHNTSIARVNAPRGSNAIGDKTDANGATVKGGRMYLHKKLWDAQNGFAAEGGATSFDDVIAVGDVILYEGTGDRILRLYHGADLVDMIQNGTESNLMLGAKENYPTRNMFYMEALDQHDADDVAWILPKGLTRISFDVSKVMDTVEINATTGSVKVVPEGSEVFDLEDFDPDTKTGDYVFARLCDKGNLQEIIVFKFVN